MIGRWIVRAGFLGCGLIYVMLLGSLAESCHAQTALTGRARVLDGDTMEVQGQQIRIHGIDAPEKGQLCTRKGSPYHCGAASLVALEELIDGRPVTCAPQEKDRYGRTVARCFVRGDLQQRDQRWSIPHIDLGGWLVRNGLAVAYVKYSRDYIPQESVARGARVGIWAGTFVQPEQWRKGVR